MLVVLGVILMIVFLVPSNVRNRAGAGTLGTIDGEPVRASEVQYYGDLFNYASTSILVPVGQDQFLPLTTAVFQEQAEKLAESPELFYLLYREAQAHGATMPREPLEQLLTQAGVIIVVGNSSDPAKQQRVPFKDIPGEQIREQVLAAAGALMSVNRSLGQYADYPRISSPLLDYYIALQAQRADLRTVVFDAMRYLEAAAAPSDDAVREHFQKYRDLRSGAADQENPFGFGYRLPDRVKFQYLTVSAAALRRHVAASLGAMPLVERERDLYRYWTENRARFPVPPSTQPATQSSTQPATSPATQPAQTPAADAPATQPAQTPAADPSATQPTTSPATLPADEAAVLLSTDPQVSQFLAEQTAQVAGRPGEADWQAYLAVHDDVAQRYISLRTNELAANLSKRLRDVLGSDYRAFDLARTTDAAPTTRPNSRAGVPVDDPEYFDRVADLITRELGVRPSVASYGRDYLTQQQAQDEKIVGPIAGAVAAEYQVMFPDYLFGGTLALLDSQQRAQIEREGAGLGLLQPSQPLVDLFGNEFVFRVTEALPDAPPAELAEVQEQVRTDLRKRAAYDTALAEAAAFAEQARQTSLSAAAQAAGLTVHDPPPFAVGAGLLDAPALGATQENDTISAAARSDFADSFYALLTDPSLADAEHPIGLLPMRPAFRVIVAELQELVGGWGDDQMLALQREQLLEQLRQQSMSATAAGDDFFDFDRAAARVGYIREKPRTPRDAGASTQEH